jgi:hypothetical protein
LFVTNTGAALRRWWTASFHKPNIVPLVVVSLTVAVYPGVRGARKLDFINRRDRCFDETHIFGMESACP